MTSCIPAGYIKISGDIFLIVYQTHGPILDSYFITLLKRSAWGQAHLYRMERNEKGEKARLPTQSELGSTLIGRHSGYLQRVVRIASTRASTRVIIQP